MLQKSRLFLFCSLFAILVGGVASASEKLKMEEHQLLDRLRKEIPNVVCSGPLAVANLNLNRQGSVIAAQPGEKFFGMLNFSYDASNLDPESLNQIVIGFAEIGPQKCIFNELGYRCGEGIASFFLKAPTNPGVYEIQCRFDQAYSPKDAITNWWVEDADHIMTIGKIIVRDVEP